MGKIELEWLYSTQKVVSREKNRELGAKNRIGPSTI